MRSVPFAKNALFMVLALLNIDRASEQKNIWLWLKDHIMLPSISHLDINLTPVKVMETDSLLWQQVK